ncbi:hypothetical protein [Ectothiorhodospira lacustris]|uniref:hypothetical protein n=1 Tax=Ectothiorhodospira lacustris TaxID=2899127 RepID=UPI001EE91279|nr:hypothetical protein [Ectothiorhodospira lacustris]MCG5509323.1 hypothetical protein [Ectothiorhodospira lacustris]MCG5521377.1 hypothetical protein [Ectothiorhodospira lacustris]
MEGTITQDIFFDCKNKFKKFAAVVSSSIRRFLSNIEISKMEMSQMISQRIVVVCPTGNGAGRGGVLDSGPEGNLTQ